MMWPAWYGCGRVNSDVLESLRHTKEPNATLGLVPDLNNYFYLHICVQTFTFRRCNGDYVSESQPYGRQEIFLLGRRDEM